MMYTYVSDISSHTNARVRLHTFFIVATRPTAAEEFRMAAILGSYNIQNHFSRGNWAFLQYLLSYITQALKVTAHSGSYVSKFGASAKFL